MGGDIDIGVDSYGGKGVWDSWWIHDVSVNDRVIERFYGILKVICSQCFVLRGGGFDV